MATKKTRKSSQQKSFNGVMIGGNASDNIITVGDNNSINQTNNSFEAVYQIIKERKLGNPDKQDLLSEVTEIEDELKKGQQADEGFLQRRLRNIGRMAPDILEVVLATMANPVSGLGILAKKVAAKAQSTSIVNPGSQ